MAKFEISITSSNPEAAATFSSADLANVEFDVFEVTHDQSGATTATSVFGTRHVSVADVVKAVASYAPIPYTKRMADMQQWTPIEHAISSCAQETERMGADPLLTRAVMALAEAKNCIAAWDSAKTHGLRVNGGMRLGEVLIISGGTSEKKQ